MAVCPRCGAGLPVDARFCPACAAAVQVSAHPEERKLVSVLVADVIGYTALSERLDPERLRSLLDAYFSAMSEVIDAWGGTVEKFIGDAIVAIFGVPAVREDDAQRALRAGLEMLERLAGLNRVFGDRYGVTLTIRIGVNSGEVIAPVGVPSGQRIVSGDVVNVAARLQEAAEPGTVLAGERTYLAARNAFEFSDPVTFALKGKAQPVAARRVLAAASEAFRGVPGLYSPLIGRDLELNALASLMEEVSQTGRPRLVTVLGPAGVGKSRLVREFGQLIRGRHPEARILRGRCLAAGQGITYWALGEILRAACAISLDDSAEWAQEKLRAGLSPILASLKLPDSEIDHTIVALAATAGIALPDSPLDRLQPQAVADEIGRAWPRFASACAAGGAGVFVIEDLHWAGEPLLDMLERLIARSGGALLVIVTARPELVEQHPGFGSGSADFSVVSLRPLTEKHSEQLLDTLLMTAELPSEMRAQILSRAEGNPFFLEEIVRRLIDEGGLVQEADRWRATPAGRRAPLPDTVHSLLAARIDSLPPTEKRVLQEAAVVGRVFWEEPVARALGSASISNQMFTLERRGFVFSRPTSSLAGQGEFSFKHALVRDVAYASLPKARRARAHAEVGVWIEELAGERVEEFAELLAHHCATAVTGDEADLAWGSDPARESIRLKAFEHCLRAGVVARRRFAVARAVELHEQAVRLAANDAERQRAFEELGGDHESSYHGDEAMAAYQRALEIARKDPSRAADHARLCFKQAWMMASTAGAFRKNPDPAVPDGLVSEGLAAAPDELSRARLLMARGMCARLWGGPRPDPMALEERISATREALRIGESRRLGDLARSATEVLRILYGIDGRFRLALEVARRQLNELDQVESRADRADMLNNAALLTINIEGDYEAGLDLVRQSYALSKDTNPHQLMHSTHGLLEALFRLGRWQELMPFLDEHLAAFEVQPDKVCSHVREGPLIGATVLMHMGNREQAQRLVALVGEPRDTLETASPWQALVAVVSGDPGTAREIAASRAVTRRTYGPRHALALVEALLALRDWDALREFLPKARGQTDGEALIGPSSDRAEGLMMAELGDRMGALKALRQAVEGFERLRVPFEAARSRQALAELLPADQARLALKSSLDTYVRLGAAPHAKAVRARLAEFAAGTLQGE